MEAADRHRTPYYIQAPRLLELPFLISRLSSLLVSLNYKMLAMRAASNSTKFNPQTSPISSLTVRIRGVFLYI